MKKEGFGSHSFTGVEELPGLELLDADTRSKLPPSRHLDSLGQRTHPSVDGVPFPFPALALVVQLAQGRREDLDEFAFFQLRFGRLVGGERHVDRHMHKVEVRVAKTRVCGLGTGYQHFFR